MWWGSATREAPVKSKTSTLFACKLLIKTFLFRLFPGKLNEQLLTILKVKNYVLLNSVQEFTEIGSWQYLPFFVRLLNESKSEAVARRCSVKKVFVKVSQVSQENTCAGVSFSIRVWGLQLKRDSGTGDFLWNLGTF